MKNAMMRREADVDGYERHRVSIHGFTIETLISVKAAVS
jgi:hypothetical protein